MARLSRWIVNIFLLLLFLHYAPSLIKSIKRTYEDILEPRTKIGLMILHGCLNDATEPAKNLKKFFENKEIKAILIKIDCPGGTAGASQALFNEIKEAKKAHVKPIVAWVQNVCTSGGYYVACATDHIITTPAALVGGIDAYIPHLSFKKFIEQFKIQYNTINAGAYLTAGNPLLDITAEQEIMFKGLVDTIYHQFTTAVAQQRPNLSLQKITTWADGKIFTGAQALELGLIDELGSQITAEQYIKQKITVEKSIQWVHPTCASRLMKFLTADACEETDDQHFSLTSAMRAFCAYVEQSWNVIVRS